MMTMMLQLEQKGVTLLTTVPGGQLSQAAAAPVKAVQGQMALEKQQTSLTH